MTKQQFNLHHQPHTEVRINTHCGKQLSGGVCFKKIRFERKDKKITYSLTQLTFIYHLEKIKPISYPKK